MKRFETTLDGSTLKLDFATAPVMTGDNESIPHESGGRFLDICGKFTLAAELEGATLASLDHVTIKPYPSFHTMWEMFDELSRLAEEGDDDSTTPKPYVAYGVMGKSAGAWRRSTQRASATRGSRARSCSPAAPGSSAGRTASCPRRRAVHRCASWARAAF